ncbi:MAG: hypothetical protein ACOYYU_13210 [Chloroflexota bacterium]
MGLGKSDWYFILFLLVLCALTWLNELNELGYGVIAFLPLMLLEIWLAKKAWGRKARLGLGYFFLNTVAINELMYNP